MKRIIFFTLFTSLLTLSVHAQIEDKRDSTSIKIEQQFPEFSAPEFSDKKLDVSEFDKDLGPTEIERRIAFVKSLKFHAPLTYKGPTQTEPNVGRILPQTGEYAFYQYIELNDDLFLSTASTHRNYGTIGSSRMIIFDLNYEVTDWLTVSGGVYGAKYNLASFDPAAGPGAIHYNDMGFNSSLRFKLHDRIYLRAHGRFSINSFDKSRNLAPETHGMYPQTYYGGGMEFKVTNKFGVEGGMVRELNPMTGKWNNTPYVMPIFYPLGR